MIYDSRFAIGTAVALALLSTLNPQLSTCFGQGVLTPPGAPAPTMKSLDQLDAKLEKRTPVSSLPFVIASSGSYYLTTNLTGVAGTNGITIAVDGVTLDLNGFTMTGVAGSSNGVFAAFGLKNIAVQNGVVRNWGRVGVELIGATSSQLADLRLSNNGSGGARAGVYCTILRCLATQNTTLGLYGGNQGLIKDSTAGNNSGDGISASFQAMIVDCSSGDNSGNGFLTASSATLRGCSANNNTLAGISTAGYCHIESCNSTLNGQQGFSSNGHTALIHCSAIKNSADGIIINDFTSVRDCTSTDNLGNGIYATGDFNRIDENFAAYNADRGIKLHAVNTSLVVRNTATANTNGDFPAAGSNIGPIQSGSAATSPTANLQL